MSSYLQPGRPRFSRWAPLGKTNLRLADPAEDIRGRWVVDSRGVRVGRVVELLADLDERRVCAVVVSSGGWFGLGRRHTPVPLDDLERVGEGQVHLRHPMRRPDGPSYRPRLVVRLEDGPKAFGPFSYSPFWGAGQECTVSPQFTEPDRRAATHRR